MYCVMLSIPTERELIEIIGAVSLQTRCPFSHLGISIRVNCFVVVVVVVVKVLTGKKL